jgi:hypothetical protein
MKKIIIMGLVSLLFSSCSIYNEIGDYVYSYRFSDISLYYGDFSEIESVDKISKWINTKIKYEKTKDILTPEEILQKGKCDCDGYSLLFMNIAYVRFGIKCSLSLVDTKDRKVVEGGDINHAIVKLPNGILIEPQTGRKVYYDVCFEYTFDEIFIKEN